MSYADKVFAETCYSILACDENDEGMEVRPRWEDGTPAHTKKKLHVVNSYDLRYLDNGKVEPSIPVMTLRKQGTKNAIDEILWIYQKCSNRKQDIHSGIWDSWIGRDGTIGRAYGYQIGQLSRHHRYNGKEDLSRYPSARIFGNRAAAEFQLERCLEKVSTAENTKAEIFYEKMEPGINDEKWVWMNQIDSVRWLLANDPGSRRIITTTYNVEDLSYMSLQPCAFQMHYSVTKSGISDKLVLSAMLYQRSQDMLTANNWNVIQYSALVHMLAIDAGMEPGIFTHVIADAHVYDRHIPIVKELVGKYYKAADDSGKSWLELDLAGNTIPHPNPRLWINPEKKNFYDFTPDDFKLLDYEYEEFNHKIPVAI